MGEEGKGGKKGDEKRDGEPEVPSRDISIGRVLCSPGYTVALCPSLAALLVDSTFPLSQSQEPWPHPLQRQAPQPHRKRSFL